MELEVEETVDDVEDADDVDDVLVTARCRRPAVLEIIEPISLDSAAIRMRGYGRMKELVNNCRISLWKTHLIADNLLSEAENSPKLQPYSSAIL